MDSQILQILITDDDEGDRKQIKRAIGQSGLFAVCTETASIEGALAACDRCEFDCAIVDYRLPGEDGLAGITALRGIFPHLAIIMSTGQGDEMVAAEAMKRGASDYFSKPRINPAVVQRAIENALEKCALQRRVIEQQQELENFARLLAHDLRAPAASIESFATRIGERLQEGNLEKALQAADWVIQTARRMNHLIDTLHRYTTADVKVDFEAIDMTQVFEAARVNLHRSIEESGAIVTADALPPVFGNAPQLAQFLQNLIANGLKYCDESVARVHLSALDCARLEFDRTLLLFSVADNGIGIPKVQRKWIFEPFARLSAIRGREGTGLGLATCRKIIERHGGTIWCESRPALGTVFFFTLPAVQPDTGRISAHDGTGAALTEVQPITPVPQMEQPSPRFNTPLPASRQLG